MKLKKETIERMKAFIASDILSDVVEEVEKAAPTGMIGSFRYYGMQFYPTDFEADEPMKRGVDECPDHYKKACATIEPRQILKMMPFQLGNACKYILRYQYKGNEKQDLLKALDYLEWAKDDREHPINNDIFVIHSFFNNDILDVLFEGGKVHYEGTREFINAILEELK